MDSSVYCLPADLLGEGADRLVGTVRDRAGVSGVTVAACYHASRDIYPHNPAYAKAQLAQSRNCTELNFYAYGLYRLQSLTQIRTALPTP